MSQASLHELSSNHPSLLTTTTGTSVQSVLHTWKSARTLLADTIQSYLSACATLNAVCTRPTHTPLEHTVVEDALVAVASELSALASEAQALRDAHFGMSTLRRRSGRLTGINALPPEILSYIFKLSVTHCMRDKALALNTPELWTHIDLSPDAPTGRSLYDAAKLQFERAQDEPVHLHLYEPRQQYGTPDVEVRKLRDFLAPYASRITALDLDTLDQSHKLIQSVLGACIQRGFLALQDLVVLVPDKTFIFRLHVREPVGKKARKHSNIAIKTLHLQNALFDWRSTIYHDLVDLRLQASGAARMDVTLLDLANVFAQSSGLVVLKLSNILVGN
ncbi:hypothetical protein FRC07_001268 [Ceratobasidium sp. 392]|nr:hypothetical protein FRC07_001268 [Ceratobasidium sp. 392]